MSQATLEVKNMTDFDRRRSVPIDCSTDAAIANAKLIKPGMALALNTTSGVWDRADGAVGDVPFMLAETKGDRLDVIAASAITALPLPSDEFWLDSFAYVGSPIEGAKLKISTGADVGKWVSVTPATVADAIAAKLTVVQIAGSDGKLLVRAIH